MITKEYIKEHPIMTCKDCGKDFNSKDLDYKRMKWEQIMCNNCCDKFVKMVTDPVWKRHFFKKVGGFLKRTSKMIEKSNKLEK